MIFDSKQTSARTLEATVNTYELLDHIADSVNPTLAVVALVSPWLPMFRAKPPAPWLRVTSAVLGVGVAYAGQALDRLTGAWPAMSLDYSGHSAICIALLVPIAHLNRRWCIAALGIGVAYGALMVYQGYHTVSDIVTTAAPVGLACEAIWRLLGRTYRTRIA
jgi:hypothetical protein